MNKKLKRQWRDIKFTLRRNLFKAYAVIKFNGFFWRLLNKKAITAFNSNKPKLNQLQENIVKKLDKDGIAVTHLNELFPREDILSELHEYLKKREHRVYQNTKKPFLEDLIAEIPELGLEVPFFNLATNDTVLDIVNSYLGMHGRLNHFNVRRTIVAKNQLPYHSQNWHRAPQEQKNCRVYIYLNDVDEDSGPFMYIPQSVTGKKYADVAPLTPFMTGYVSAEAVELKVPENERMTVTGKAGTVIFCDSTGLHRGGLSTERPRIMSTFGYGAPSFRENIQYSFSNKVYDSLKDSSVARQEVLNPKWMRG